MPGLWLCLCLLGVTAAGVLPADKTNSPCTPGTVWMSPDGCNTCFCLENGVPGCSRMDCADRESAEKKTYDGFSNSGKPMPLPPPEEKSVYYDFSADAKPMPLPKPEEKSVYHDFSADAKPIPLPKPEEKNVYHDFSADAKPMPLPKPEEKSIYHDFSADAKPMPLPKPEEKSVYHDFSAYDKPMPLPKPEEKSVYHDFSAYDKSMALPEPEPMEERQGVNCTRGEEWQEECNSCLCLEDGVAGCTKMGCSVDGRTLAKELMDHCEPGDTWTDDCNVCHCVGRDQVVCSYGVCPTSKTGGRRRRRQASCNPGEVRQVECNSCLCLPNGHEACTRKFCLPAQSQQNKGFSSLGDTDCAQTCPADCAGRRGADGCMVCDCSLDPFFGVLPPLPPAPSDQGWQLGGR